MKFVALSIIAVMSLMVSHSDATKLLANSSYAAEDAGALADQNLAQVDTQQPNRSQ